MVVKTDEADDLIEKIVDGISDVKGQNIEMIDLRKLKIEFVISTLFVLEVQTHMFQQY